MIRSAGLGGSIAFNAQNVDGRRNLFLDYGGLVQTTATGVFSWSSSSTDAQTGGDLFLYRDAANTLAQYNSTSAQAHRIYNTRTDASNGEWATINWASNVLHIGATKNGTGTARVMQLDYGGTTTAAISVPITSGQVTFGGGFVAGGTQTLGANYHEMTEMTAPSAPATNSVRVYAEDTGGGKTRLCALFPTGAAQCFATEP